MNLDKRSQRCFTGAMSITYAEQIGYKIGATEQRNIDYDKDHIKLILQLAHNYGVCSDWGESVVNHIIEDLPSELKTLEAEE